MEYISLHGYIRNTPSDMDVHAEHQLRVNRRKRMGLTHQMRALNDRAELHPACSFK